MASITKLCIRPPEMSHPPSGSFEPVVQHPGSEAHDIKQDAESGGGLVFDEPSLGDLPSEIVDHILHYLDNEPPSTSRIYEWPRSEITRCEAMPLKRLSVTSRFLRRLVLKRLFAFCSIQLSDLHPFLEFFKENKEILTIRSIVVMRQNNSDGLIPIWWAKLLAAVETLDTLSIIAPPWVFAELASCSIVDCDNWAFNIPFQIIQLKQPRQKLGMPLQSDDNLFNARPWTSMLINEGSSLKAYSTYEYYFRRIPSLISTFATKRATCPDEAMMRLTHFHYTAIFPFYNHVDDVLKLVRNTMMLKSFTIKLAPDPASRVIEYEQGEGRIDLADAWMELETAYELVAHTVMALGWTSSLERFQSFDFGIEGLRDSLEKKLGHLKSSWSYLGNGQWIRNRYSKTHETASST